jgi:type I restriction enzyme S subunit
MSDHNGLPTGWAEAQLRQILQPLDNGKVLHHGWSPQCESFPSPNEDAWGVLKTTAVQEGQYEEQHNKALPAGLKPRPDLEVMNGDLLLTCAGPRSRCGVACVVRSTRRRLILSGKMYRFRPNSALMSPAYLEAYLCAKDTQIAIDAMKTGISDSGLNLTHDKFLSLPVRIPPLTEQHRIVQKIDESFSNLDAAVASLLRAKSNLKRYRASVLKSAVEGRLTEEWRREHPQAEDGQLLRERILRERREKWEKEQLARFKEKGEEPPKNWRGKYKEPSAPDTNELPQLPEGWVWASVEQLSDALRTVTYGVVKLGETVAGGVPVLRCSNVRSLVLELDEVKAIAPKIANQYQRTFLAGRELLITVRGTLGGVVAAPDECRGWNVSREVAVVALMPPVVPRAIAVFVASSPLQKWLAQHTRGIAYTGINIETLKELPVPLPSAAEQERVVALVEERLTQIDASEKTIDAELIRAKRLRQAILKQAFEGKLVPQDPSDEPASVLLERIRATRQQEVPKRKTKKVTAK